jgi:hypothetical protein
MSAYNVYAGEAQHGPRRFTPKGRLLVYHEGAAPNPTTRLGSGGYSARLFVGLNVGQRKAYTIDDVVKIVWSVRKKQGRSGDDADDGRWSLFDGGSPRASILAQRGIYEDRSGKRVVEQSVQVVVIDFSGATKKQFTDEMIDLGETLRKRMKQETVILEIQRADRVVDVFSITE